MSAYFTAPDGDGEPSLWRIALYGHQPKLVMRWRDLPESARDLWPLFTGAVCEENPLALGEFCGVCGARLAVGPQGQISECAMGCVA